MTARSADEIRADLAAVASPYYRPGSPRADRLVADVPELLDSRERAIRWAVTLENRIERAHDLALLYSSDAFGYDEIAAALTGSTE